MAEPTVPVPVSLATRLLEGRETVTDLRELRALLSQPTPTAERDDLFSCLEIGDDGYNHWDTDALDRLLERRMSEPAAAPPSIADMVPGTRITGRSTVTGVWVQATVETGGTLIIGDTHWGASVLDPSTIRDVREPGRPMLQDSDTLTKIRAAHTEYRNTGDLHELARALNTLLGT